MSILAFSPFWALTSFRSWYIFPLCQRHLFDWKSSYVCKAGRQQEINFRFTLLPRLFHFNFNDNILTKKRKRKENYLAIVYAIRQGLQKIFPQVNKKLANQFESLPHVLANSRENNTNKSHINQFPAVDATLAEEVYVILYLLSLFQNNKSYLQSSP